MYKCCQFIILATLVAFSPLSAQGTSLFGGRERAKPQIIIKNRVLAKVNQKPISVLDLVKKMDMAFFRQYPQYADSNEIRYQFYEMSWRDVLNEFIDKELILADAEEMKIEVPLSDIRKEIEKIFGPTIIDNLDKAGLSMDEASKLLKEEQTLQKMMYLRVNSKVFSEVTPQEVRLAYDQFLKEYNRQDQWEYYVITIKDPDPLKLERLMARIEEELRVNPPKIEDFLAFTKSLKGYNAFTQVKVSDQFLQKEADLSPAYKQALSSLSPGTYSTPQEQTRDGPKTYKLYFLSDVIIDQYPSFLDMVPKLKNERMGKVAERETVEYKKKLRKQYPISMVDLASFDPFSLEVNGQKIQFDLPTKKG